MEQFTNQVTIRGILAQAPEFSHENHGKRFFRLLLEVERLSMTVDLLPVVVPQRLLPELEVGESILVTGQMRSHNIRDERGRHLLIFVFAETVIPEPGEPENKVLLTGKVCRSPIHRRTPLGREICDVMLAVPRAFQRADYLPCILWGRTAREASACNVGDLICLEGRLQSRQYTKVTGEGSQLRTAYEISALTAQVMAQEG